MSTLKRTVSFMSSASRPASRTRMQPARLAVLGVKQLSNEGKAPLKPRLFCGPATASSESNEYFGMDASEGLFGFNPFAELWVGRLAMMGFVTSIVEEAITGNGTLRQIGFDAPSASLLATLVAAFGGATLASAASTLRQAQDGSMPALQARRFRSLMGLERETFDIEQTRKSKSDPIISAMADNAQEISDARAAGTVADEFFSDEVREAKATSTAMKAVQQVDIKDKGTSVSLAARDDVLEQAQFKSELAYAKQVELENGRYAMLGFMVAVLVEAGTGHGIIMQIIDILKIVGLLGPDSGF